MGLSKPGVLAGLLAAVVLGDVAVALHVSDRQRADEAAAAAQADATWVADLREVGQELLLARAPVSDAANVFSAGELSDAVRYDVYVRGAAAADLAGVGERLRAVQVPLPRGETHRLLTVALDAMTEAVVQLADEADTDVEDELVLFTDAARDWDRLVTAEVAKDLPSGTTIGSQLPLTRAGQIFRWSSACAEASDDDQELLGQPTDREQAAVELESAAGNLDELLTALLEVRPAEADAAEVQRDLEPALRGLRERVAALERFGAAVRAQDRAGAAEAIVLLDRLAPLGETASRVFEARGSTVCSDFFDPGVLLGEVPPSDDATDT